MRRWIFALPVETEVWAWSEAAQDYLPRFVTEAEGAALVAETQRALAHWRAVAPAGLTPYTPPILVEHQRQGARQGGIEDVRLAGVGDRRGIYLLAAWTEQAWARVCSDVSTRVSIGTTPKYRDGDGAEFGPLIDELSLTEHPRLKSIGTIQDTMALRLADALNTRGAIVTPEEMMAKFEELMAANAALMDRVAALEAALAEEAELADEEKKEEEKVELADEGDKEAAVMALSDRLVAGLLPSLERMIGAQLKGMRLGDVNGRGANPPIPEPEPKTAEERLAAAKKRGLKGEAAVLASLV
jgi:hypothetical protein